MSKLENQLYNVVGALSLLQDKMKELTEDLIQNNAYTQEEGKRIVTDISYKIQTEVEQLQQNIRFKYDEVSKQYNLPDIEKIKQDIVIVLENIKQLTALGK